MFSSKETIVYSMKPYDEFRKEIKAIYKQGGLPGQEDIFVCDAATDSLFSFTYNKYRRTSLTLEGRYSFYSNNITKIRFSYLPDLLSILGLILSLIVGIAIIILSFTRKDLIEEVPLSVGFYILFASPILIVASHYYTRIILINKCIDTLNLISDPKNK